MPIDLSVKDVRLELLRAAGAGEQGQGDPATLLLGTLFHEVFADLVSRDPRRSGVRVLFEAGEGEDAAARSLLDHTYRTLVGPRVSRHQAQLNETTPAFLTFWSAVRHLTRWLADFVARVRAVGDGSVTSGATSWQTVAGHFAAEEALACELRGEGWSQSVRLTGTADSIVRAPDGGRVCAIELKLGRGKPAVDLGQAALYRLIAARGSSGDTAVALLRFSGKLEEMVITPAQIGDAETKLLALIGKMAGVTAVAPRPAPSVSSVGPAAPDRHAELAQRIVRVYREYGRPIEISGPPIVGPRFLRFEIQPGKGVAVSQIERLTPEVNIRAGLASEPIVRPIAGHLYIDVERPDPQIVPFDVVRARLGGPIGPAGSAQLPIGVEPGGKLVCADLSAPTSAHVLVAGSAGSGKSEWLRMALGGLMVANSPATLRLATIDPKSSAFNDLRGTPWLLHKDAFWTPGQRDASGGVVDIIDFLQELVDEMDARYQTLQAARADDLASYVKAGAGAMPRLVVFLDEYFSLITGDRRLRKEIEERISLLASKGRAAGVHLVIATQQASREVIRGPLDANLSCRVALRVPKALESRLLLETAGAERLTGYGDLMYKDIGDPVRLQAPFLTAPERARLFANARAG